VPTDDLGNESPPGDNPPEPTTPPTEVPAGLTAEDLSNAMQSAVATNNQEVMAMVQGLQGKLEELATAQNPPPGAPEVASELAERLLTDPEATIRDLQNKWGREELAPILGRSLEVDRDGRVDAQAARVDEKYGEGFFDANIRDRLVGPEGNLSAYPINQQADPSVINSAVNGVLGNMMMDSETGPMLEEAMAKTAKAKAERDVRQPTNLMGPGRAQVGATTKLSPEMLEAIDKFSEVLPEHIKINEATIKGSMNRENTLEAWQAAQKGSQ